MPFNNLVFIDNMEKNMSDETDFMEKNMTSVTPTSELDDGLTTWLLATLTKHAITSSEIINRMVRIMIPVTVRVASSHVVRPLSNSEVGVTLVMFFSMKSGVGEV